MGNLVKSNVYLDLRPSTDMLLVQMTTYTQNCEAEF